MAGTPELIRVVFPVVLAVALCEGQFVHTQAGGFPSRSLVRYADVSIDTLIDGNGPAIVLLPSLGRGSEDYHLVTRALAGAGFRVLRPQPRGIAQSSGPTTNITLHDLARDVAEVIRQLGDGRAVVVGHAYGNWVARMVAVDYPDQVRGVVLAAAAARQYDASLSDDVNRASDPRLPEADRMVALRRAFFAPGNDPREWLDGWHPEVRASQRAAAAAVAQSQWWGAGRAPILELQAEHDPFKTPDQRSELKDELGDRVTVVVIPKASHALFPEQPDAVAQALHTWIAALKP